MTCTQEKHLLRWQMDEGYYSDVRPFIDFTIPASIFAILVAFAATVHATFLFRRYGKEELFVPVVRFDPPEDLSPMEVGYLADGVVDNKDLTSMIFYWADQGCLTISELSKKEFTFTKIKEPATTKAHEKHLFSALFACGDGTEVTLKQLEKGTFSKDLEKAKTEVRSYFKGERELRDGKAERKRIAAMLYGALSVVMLAIASTISYIGTETVVFLVVGFSSLGVFALVASRLNAIWETSSAFKKGFKFFLLGVFGNRPLWICFFVHEFRIWTWCLLLGSHGVIPCCYSCVSRIPGHRYRKTQYVCPEET